VKYNKTVDHVDIPKFMGTWYVWAGRTTFLEKGAHNSIEIYTWNEKKERIDIDFKFRKDSFDGPVKEIPQKAWIYNNETNAHWKVQPFWPLKLDYLVIALSPDYEWTAIGVPNTKYLWIMGRTPNVSDQQLSEITQKLDALGYPTENILRIPQNGVGL
jgi:apolipoprotein D and lipocalin family protein